MKRFILASFMVLFFATMVFAATRSVQFSWTASTSPTVTGYKIYWGETKGGPYPNVGDVQMNLSATIATLDDSVPHYLVATAYDTTQESPYSNELAIYPIIATASTGGTISPTTDTFFEGGSSVTYTATPASGYVFIGFLVDDARVTSTSYTFSNIQAKHIIKAMFASKLLPPGQLKKVREQFAGS